MLQSLGWAALGTGFTFLMTALGAAMVFFFAGEPRPHFQKTLLGFAAGVMTAASVWLLPMNTTALLLFSDVLFTMLSLSGISG